MAIRADITVDWWRIIVDLHRAGMTIRKIANQLGVGRNKVNRWKNEGVNPDWIEGGRLMTLWVKQGGDLERIPLLGSGHPYLGLNLSRNRDTECVDTACS